jgi:hypothetical protein
VELLEEFLKFLFLLRGPAQLEQHVLHKDVVVHLTAIILARSLRMRIAA